VALAARHFPSPPFRSAHRPSPARQSYPAGPLFFHSITNPPESASGVPPRSDAPGPAQGDIPPARRAGGAKTLRRLVRAFPAPPVAPGGTAGPRQTKLRQTILCGIPQQPDHDPVVQR
jgi:hypothetical protein